MLIGFPHHGAESSSKKMSSDETDTTAKKGNQNEEHTNTITPPVLPSGVFKQTGAKLSFYCINRLTLKDIPRSLAAAAGVYLVVLVISLISTQLAGEYSEALKNPVAWSIDTPWMLPLVFLTCIATGYREEMFFRAYFIRRFEIAGFPPAVGVGVTTLLFSLGHLYQGLAGLVGTLLIGLYFGFLFLRIRNLHVLAIAHAIFNFINLLFAAQLFTC